MAEECMKQSLKDRNWRRDFAFLKTGGDIISGLTSNTMKTTYNHQFSSVGPEMAISGDASSGTCWAFPGIAGQIGISLSRRIKVQATTIEHIGAKLAQKEITLAPKDFELWGIEGEGEVLAKRPLIKAFYDINNASTIQTFEVKEGDPSPPYQKVLLKILSNHGNSQHTCLYRVRIHGEEA
jgi:SUN domain-containing protein 1/2